MDLEEFRKAGNQIAIYQVGTVPILGKPIIRCDLLDHNGDPLCDNGDPMIRVRIADAKRFIASKPKPPTYLRLRDIYLDFNLNEKLPESVYETLLNRLDSEKISSLRGIYDYLAMHNSVKLTQTYPRVLRGEEGRQKMTELANYLLSQFCKLNGIPNVIEKKDNKNG